MVSQQTMTAHIVAQMQATATFVLPTDTKTAFPKWDDTLLYLPIPSHLLEHIDIIPNNLLQNQCQPLATYLHHFINNLNYPRKSFKMLAKFSSLVKPSGVTTNIAAVNLKARLNTAINHNQTVSNATINSL